MSPSTFQAFVRVNARRARRRIQARVEPHLKPKPWVERALKIMPEPVLDALRETLGIDAQLVEVRARLGELFREKRTLKDRQAAFDAARADLDKAWAALKEAQLNLRGREARVEAREATLRREEAAARRREVEQTAERLIPVRQIVNALPARPRSPLGMQHLIHHMRRFGQQTPVVVRLREDGRFQLLSGRRRLEALRRLEATHARARVVEMTDAEAAALYVAENYITLGISPQALKRDAAELRGRPHLEAPVDETLIGQAECVDELDLAALLEEARYHLTEGASWLLSLRAHWHALAPEERARLEALLDYFTQLARFLKAKKTP